MSMRIFLAGATGVIGRRLMLLLGDAGYTLTCMTRSQAKADGLREAGFDPVVIDVYDAEALAAAVRAAKPDVVIHQLTDLPKNLDPALMPDAIPRNARVRIEGTRNLVAAARAAGAKRLIAQSLAWVYAPGPPPHTETDPLDAGASGPRAVTIGGVISLEQQVLHAAPIVGLVLRYGQLYGPGTGTENASGTSPIHADAAAYAAYLAVEHGGAGAYNLAEPNGQVTTDKARFELGWRSDFRLPAAGTV